MTNNMNISPEVQQLVDFYKNLSYNIFKFLGLAVASIGSLIFVFNTDFSKTFAIYENKAINLQFLKKDKQHNIWYSDLIWY
jgi:hypothetical protein